MADEDEEAGEEEREADEDESPLTAAEVAGEVLRSERFWKRAEPLVQRWLDLKARECVGFERLSWGYVGMRLALLFAICVLVWNDKIAKEVAAAILGGIASALFMERRKS